MPFTKITKLLTFWNHLRIDFRHDAHYPLISHCIYPKYKNNLLFNHKSIIKHHQNQKLNVDQYYHLINRPQSNFTDCPNNVLCCPRISSRIMYDISLSLKFLLRWDENGDNNISSLLQVAVRIKGDNPHKILTSVLCIWHTV